MELIILATLQPCNLAARPPHVKISTMHRKQSLWKRATLGLRWLSLGIGIKRWLPLLGGGAVFAGIGIAYLAFILHEAGWLPDLIYDIIFLDRVPVRWRITIMLSVGGGMILFALVKLGHNLIAPFRRPDQPLVESLYDHRRQGRGPRIVAIGGGTGLPALLRGLTASTSNITAIITVADDGGSSGRLREQLGVLPPGDFRNNIAALSRDETLMTQLLQYRFGGEGSDGGELQGHAFGNLLLAALMGITGSFDEALAAAERVLAMRGRVMPSTLAAVDLTADVAIEREGEGAVIERIVGESAIPKSGGRIQQVYLQPANAPAYPPAVQALLRADMVLIGPGSLYTSILPNLLVGDIAEALRRTRAKKIYICNIATQPGETDGYTVADHVAVLQAHIGDGCIDLALANDNLTAVPPDDKITQLVQPIPPPQVEMITTDLADNERPWRHDSGKVATAVFDLLHKR